MAHRSDRSTFESRRAFLVATFSALAVPAALAPRSAFAAPAVDAGKYFPVVRKFADEMIGRGRDRYGKLPTAMFMSVLDRRTFAPPEKLPDGPGGLRAQDRSDCYGSNLQHQFNYLRVFEILGELTGKAEYVEAARAAVLDTFRHAQSPVTGLIGWGEHLYWDTREDRVATLYVGPPMFHETKRNFPYWTWLHSANPTAATRFALGLWEHQIADQETGDFSRHARWDDHRPGKGRSFPREGSYMIDVWSQAHADTGDAVYLRAIDVLTRRYLSKLSSRSLLEHGEYDPERCITLAMLHLAINGHAAAERLPPGEVRDRLRQLCTEMDRGFLALDHQPLGRGLVRACYTSTGAVQPWRRTEPEGASGYAPAWESGYGLRIAAEFAVRCFDRYRQLPDGTVKTDYGRLVIESAEAYEGSEPPPDADLWPREFGYAVAAQLAAHEISGDANHLARARRLADQALAIYFDDTSPLPKASKRASHYESATMSDVLLHALLRLELAMANRTVSVPNVVLD